MSSDENRKPVAENRKADADATPATDSRLSAPVLYRMPMELRWRDLDAFNHVNNSSFLTFLEEARIRWFASLGTEWVTETIAPLLAAVQINYRRPIPYPSDIAIELFAERVGNSSLSIGHRIQSGDDVTLYADGHVVMVWIERASGRSTPLPASVREAAQRSFP